MKRNKAVVDKHNYHAILEGREVKIVDTIHPLGLSVWARWFEKANRHIGKDRVGDIEISTVFLGLNHGWFEKSLWFETMIFGGEYDGYQERYETYEEAEEGHKRIVEAVKENKVL